VRTHKDELLAFRLKTEEEQKQALFDEIDSKATKLKCSFELARYIIHLEHRLDGMMDLIDALYR